MDRRRTSLVLLLAFIVCTGIAIAAAGPRPASDPGAVALVVQGLGYLLGLVAAGLMLVPAGRATAPEADRRLGGVLLAGFGVLLVLDVVALLAGQDGAAVGAGLARLILLVLIGVASIRLALSVAADRRAR